MRPSCPSASVRKITLEMTLSPWLSPLIHARRQQGATIIATTAIAASVATAASTRSVPPSYFSRRPLIYAMCRCHHKRAGNCLFEDYSFDTQSNRRGARKLLFSSSAFETSGKKSPHVILQVNANASKDEIKAAFRKLAKKHHPDLKMHRRKQEQQVDHKTFNLNSDTKNDNENGDDMMSALIQAYETLMNKHNKYFWSDDNARDSRVALACEMYSIEELRSMHHSFDVYSFRVSFCRVHHDGGGESVGDGSIFVRGSRNNQQQHSRQSSSTLPEDPNTRQTHIEIVGNAHPSGDNSSHVKFEHQLESNPIIPLEVHPDDSISDMKRHIQSQYGSLWGLEGRRLDRDGVYLGWELVYSGTHGNCDVGDNMMDGKDGYVLSYHLFLHNYGIQEGDILHAVVRRMK